MPTILGTEIGSNEGSKELSKEKGLYSVVGAFTITYIVISDNLNQYEDEVLETTGLPRISQRLRGCFCIKRTAKAHEQVVHPTTGVLCELWRVVCDFDDTVDPAKVPGGEGSEENDPVSTPTRRNWYTEKIEEVLEKDPVTGAPIITEANEPIDVTHRKVCAVLEIIKYEDYPYDPLTILKFVDHVNDRPFYGAPKGTALMDDMTIVEEEIEGETYDKVTYRIIFKMIEEPPGDPANPPAVPVFKEDTWKLRLLHQGFMFRKALGAKPQLATDKHGNPIRVNLRTHVAVQPIPGVPGGGLIDGRKLNEDDDPNFLEFYGHPYANFDDLSLEP
jgi:hypothetical protein